MKPIRKFNNGNGALLCNICRTIIATRDESRVSKQLLCDECSEKTIDMKTIIEFNMDEPDDVGRHQVFMKSEDMANAIWEIQMNLAKKYEKYRTPKEGETYEDAVEQIFKDINEILEDEGIDIYNLIQ